MPESKISEILRVALEFRKRKAIEHAHLSAPASQVIVESCDVGLAWLDQREKAIETLKSGLNMLDQEIYASEPFNQAEQYADVAAALKWLEGAK